MFNQIIISNKFDLNLSTTLSSYKADSQHGILQVQISWSMANGDGKVGRTVLITRMYLEVKLGLGTRRK